jgi:hypothetical protein
VIHNDIPEREKKKEKKKKKKNKRRERGIVKELISQMLQTILFLTHPNIQQPYFTCHVSCPLLHKTVS